MGWFSEAVKKVDPKLLAVVHEPPHRVLFNSDGSVAGCVTLGEYSWEIWGIDADKEKYRLKYFESQPTKADIQEFKYRYKKFQQGKQREFYRNLRAKSEKRKADLDKKRTHDMTEFAKEIRPEVVKAADELGLAKSRLPDDKTYIEHKLGRGHA